jgi:hypothetical protein
MRLWNIVEHPLIIISAALFLAACFFYIVERFSLFRKRVKNTKKFYEIFIKKELHINPNGFSSGDQVHGQRANPQKVENDGRENI